MIGALELGFIYGIMALGVYLTFRVLNFPDLTVDGSFTSGAATAAILIINGHSPWIATIAGAGSACSPVYSPGSCTPRAKSTVSSQGSSP